MTDVVVFGGQSNMQGQSEALSEREIVKNALEYRLLTDTFVPLGTRRQGQHQSHRLAARQRCGQSAWSVPRFHKISIRITFCAKRGRADFARPLFIFPT